MPKSKPKPNFNPNPDQVYHMIDVAVARDVYLPQISRALRRNGRLLITDHGPTDACVTTRKGAALGVG